MDLFREVLELAILNHIWEQNNINIVFIPVKKDAFSKERFQYNEINVLNNSVTIGYELSWIIEWKQYLEYALINAV